MGSDGLFDNIFIDLMTYLANLIALCLSKGKSDRQYIEKAIEATIDMYYYVVQRRFNEVMQSKVSNTLFGKANFKEDDKLFVE